MELFILFNDIYNSIILGIIQGVTEFFPISSSGHILIFEKMLNMDENGSFMEIVLHGGTLLSILIYYWKDIKYEISKVLKNDFTFLKNIILATLPAAIFGYYFKDEIISYFFSSDQRFVYLSISYLVCSVVLFSSKFIQDGDKGKSLTLKVAILIGFAQLLAVFPGISRSGMTISIALLLGIHRKDAAKFSFMLAIPIILFAFISGIVENYSELAKNKLPLLCGFLSSAFVGYFVISTLVKLVENRKLWVFSIYCLMISLILFIMII